MKGKILFLLLLSMSCALTVMDGNYVRAAEKEAYYVNNCGVEFTKKQYDKLTAALTKSSVENMSEGVAEVCKNSDLKLCAYQEKYFKVIETIGFNEKVIATREEEITKQEADNFMEEKAEEKSNISTINNVFAKVETSMKVVTIEIRNGNTKSNKFVIVRNKWKSLPKVRSYDVIGIRPAVKSVTFNLAQGNITGFQEYDGKTINYNYPSNHFNMQSSMNSHSGGIGLSMNLVDSAKKEIVNELQAVFVSGENPFKAYGSYQHATENVTLTQSKNYKINFEGYGQVFKFDSSVKGKYDNTSGVFATFKMP